MKNDEFNEIKITNEKEQYKIEFGKTQNSEFTFYNDNKREARDELNATTNKNNENVQLGKHQTNNNDLIDKVMKATTSTAASTSATTSTAAASASSIGGTVSTIVGATVVAVTTISTFVGIGAISSNNASCRFENFYISEESVSYYLELKDTNEDKFKIWVENSTYLSYRDLEEGMNEGSFDGLVNNTRYRIYVKEDADNGKIIYDSNFVTTSESTQGPEFYGVFNGQEVDYRNYTFSIILSYDDEDDYFSNFELTLTKTFSLEKTYDEQILSGKEDDEIILDIRNSQFDIYLTYLAGEEEVVYHPDYYLDFTNGGTMTSGISNFEVLKEANYLTYEIYVSLDIRDDFDIIEDIELTISGTDTSKTFALARESGTFGFSGLSTDGEVELDVRNDTFTYKLTYLFDGVEQSIVEDTPFTFSDSTNSVSEFRGVTISDTANFVTYEFTVTLDYVDDFNIYDRFHIYISNVSGGGHGYDLEKTTEPQTLQGKIDDEVVLDVRNGTFSYLFAYYDNDNLTQFNSENDFSFTDNSNYEPYFTSITIDETANFRSGEFNVTLDYSDEFDDFSEFILYMCNPGYQKEDGMAIELSKTLEKQTFLDAEYDIDVKNINYDYYLTYVYQGNVVDAAFGSVAFKNIESTFDGFDTDFSVVHEAETADEPHYYYLPFKMNYSDPSTCYEEFKLVVNDTYEVYVEDNTEWNLVDISSFYEDIANQECTFKVTANVYDFASDSTNEAQTLASKVGTVHLQSESNVYGLQILQYEIPLSSPYLNVVLVSYDPSEIFSNYQLVFKTANENTYIFNIDVSSRTSINDELTVNLENDYQGNDVSSALLNDLQSNPTSVYLQYYDNNLKDSVMVLVIEDVVFYLYA